MGERQAEPVGRARPAERARRVALDDQQFGRGAVPVALERARDFVGMGKRITPPGAAEGFGETSVADQVQCGKR
jgi:hypothetical protein